MSEEIRWLKGEIKRLEAELAEVKRRNPPEDELNTRCLLEHRIYTRFSRTCEARRGCLDCNRWIDPFVMKEGD